MDNSIGLATRVYRRLLLLYPAPFRRKYGPLMVAAFEQLCEEGAAGGPISLLRVWIHALFDLAGSLLVEHLEEKGRWMMSRQFWFLWIGATIAGWLGGLAVGWLLLPSLPNLALPVGAALVSALHVLLLQRFAAPAGWWRVALPLAAASWLLPLGLFALVPRSLSGPIVVVTLGVVLLASAVLVGLLQGFALRPLLRAPWQWVLVPAGAILAAGAVALVLLNTLLPLAANLVARGAFSFRLSSGIIGPHVAREMGLLLPLLYLVVVVAASAVYGLVTGMGFVWVGDRSEADGTGIFRLPAGG